MDYLFTKDTYHKVMDYLSENLYSDKELCKFLSHLESYGHIILVGGSIKDIGFFDKSPKDFDLVIKTNRKLDMSMLPESFNVGLNAYKEPKIKYKNIVFDVMSAIDKTEFRLKVIQFNTDGLYINLSTGRYESHLYNQAIIDGTLKIVSDEKYDSETDRTKKRLRKYIEKLNLEHVKS